VLNNFQGEGKIVRVTDWSKNDAVPIKTAAGLTKTMAPRTKDTIKEEPLPVVKADIREYYQNILTTIAGETQLRVSLESVMRNMKLMEAIFASAKSGNPVTFE
jgi:predicted dehydrogenase